MDILYIIGEGCSQCNNKELRYSLRSIEKYGKGVCRVYVVGYCPDWLSDEVVKIPFTQPFKRLGDAVPDSLSKMANKHSNLIASLLYAVDNSDIGDEFLVSCDDHIYIREVDFDNYPFYCKKFKDDNLLPMVGGSKYQKTLANTRAICKEDGLSEYYATLHRNMHISRKSINECRERLENAAKTPTLLEPFAYLINHRYTKDKDFEFTVVKDLKIDGAREWYRVNSKDSEVFSMFDFKKGCGLDTLIRLKFPNKSKYEK